MIIPTTLVLLAGFTHTFANALFKIGYTKIQRFMPKVMWLFILASIGTFIYQDNYYENNITQIAEQRHNDFLDLAENETNKRDRDLFYYIQTGERSQEDIRRWSIRYKQLTAQREVETEKKLLDVIQDEDFFNLASK